MKLPFASQASPLPSAALSLRSLGFLLFICICIGEISKVEAAIVIEPDGSPSVIVAQGKVIGSWGNSRDSPGLPTRKYASFLGVPYAKRPEKFMGPTEFPASYPNGVKNATTPGDICCQIIPWTGNFVQAPENEDCLNLDVYVPQRAGTSTVPMAVMYYIYGTNFNQGLSYINGPEYLMERDIILVSVNYRTNPFGFLNLQNGVVEGNQGLKDLIWGLKWVKANIQAFGGDVNSITIFGSSTGSALAHCLTLTPAATGLFHKAIIQSVSCLGKYSFKDKSTQGTDLFMRNLFCLEMTPTQQLECMNGKSNGNILFSGNNLFSFWGPSDDSVSSDPIFPVTSDELSISGKNNSASVPLMIGLNEKEGFYNAFDLLGQLNGTDFLNSNWTSGIKTLLGPTYPTLFDHPSKERATSDAIRELYFPGVSTISRAHVSELADIISDYNYAVFLRRTVINQKVYNPNIFIYKFVYHGQTSFSQGLGAPIVGPIHQDEIMYLLPYTYPDGNPLYPPLNPADVPFSIKMTGLWTSFATGGRPLSWGATWNPVPIGPDKTLSKPLSFFKIQNNPTVDPEIPAELKRVDLWYRAVGFYNSGCISGLHSILFGCAVAGSLFRARVHSTYMQL